MAAQGLTGGASRGQILVLQSRSRARSVQVDSGAHGGASAVALVGWEEMEWGNAAAQRWLGGEGAGKEMALTRGSGLAAREGDAHGALSARGWAAGAG